MIVPRSCGTHNGAFHADEVTAVALLIIFGKIDEDKVVRTRDVQKLKACEYVCDVGNVYNPKKKLFDHHQHDYTGELSSAGMVLLYLRDEGVINEDIYGLLNNLLIKGIDAQDNGVFLEEEGFTTFSDVIENFVPVPQDLAVKNLDESFVEALHFTMGHLKRMISKHQYELQYRDDVKKCMDHSTEILIFDKLIPWMENFFNLGGENHPALFVVMPAGNQWKLRGIPPNKKQKMKVRLPLPEEWAGLNDTDLAKVSQIHGAIFCHRGRFISFWKTKEDALKAVHYVLRKRNEEK